MRIEGGTVRLVDLAAADGSVRNVEAHQVTFLGPAVVLTLEGTSLDGCTWDSSGGAEAVVWTVERGRPFLAGGVALHGCSFVECRMVGIGVALLEDDARQFFRDVFDQG